MDKTDYDRFHGLMVGMGKMFEREVDNTLLDAYWVALSDWTLVDFEQASAYLMAHSEFMPRPAQYLALRKAARPTAAEAWARILQHTKGAYRDGSGLDDGGPIDTAVSGLGGYRAIAFHNLDYIGVLQRQFVDRYEEQVDVLGAREGVPRVAGPVKALPSRSDAGDAASRTASGPGGGTRG